MGRPKIYNINEEYFNQINNKNKAYVLGFIYADGHLNKKSLNITLQEKDLEILEFIKRELESTHPIYTKIIKDRRYSSFNISNVKISKSLISNFNIPSNKSKNNLSIPDIPEEYISHFLRGVFDGDGSVWSSKTKTGEEYGMSYSGGESFLVEIQYILSSLNINSSLRYRYGLTNKNSCSIEIKGSVQLGRFFDYIYKDANFFLERKHKKLLLAKQAGERHSNKMLATNGIGDEILRMYNLGIKQKKIHESLNIPFSTVRSFIRRKRKEGVIS